MKQAAIMPPSSISKEEVLSSLTRTFQTYGYEGASLTRLSNATGLGRSSLYHYFPGGKEEMARAVLDDANQWLEENILKPLAVKGSPENRLREMTAKLDAFYSSGQEMCLLGIMAIGDAHDLFQHEVGTTIRRWVKAISEVFVDAGYSHNEATKLATEVVRDIQGALIISRGLNDTKPFLELLDELPTRVVVPASKKA